MGMKEREYNIKIMRCAIAEWELERYQGRIEADWQRTLNSEAFFGKNRYQKLALALRLIDSGHASIFGINEYISWIITYENPTREQLLEAADRNRIFKHVISWDARMEAQE